MKKLFLTSGVILCMASPAFATDPLHDITSDGKDATNTSITANCTEPYLGSYTGPVNYEAKWEAICYAGGVNLDSNKYSSATGNAQLYTADTAATPTPIWVRYDDGMYTNDKCSAKTGLSGANNDTVSAPILTGYTFAGFYDTKANASAASTPDAEHQMIGTDGKITNAGKTNSSLSNTANTPSTWFARWTPNEYTITLNKNADHHGSTDASPTTLYTRYDEGVYLSSADRTSSTNAMSTSANGLTTVPGGATYTLTLDTNTSTIVNGSHTDAQVTAKSGTGTKPASGTTTATMQFDGFFSAATGGNKYIDSAGKITSGANGGIAAGTKITANDTWYAQYVCQNANTYEPELTGYTFNGWFDASSNGTAVNDFCLTSNKTVYAHWTPKTYDVVYNKGAHAKAGSTDLANYTDTDGATYDATYTALNFNDSPISLHMQAADGYTFRGWSTDTEPTVSKSGNTYTVSNAWTGETWTRTSALTVYAAYTANDINITFNCAKPVKDADVPGASPAATYAVSATGTISSNPSTHVIPMDGHSALTETCSLQGWTFDGWSCTNGLTTDSAGTQAATFITKTQLEATGGYTVYMKNAGGVTCTAKWTQNNIGLHWYNDTVANSGTQINVTGTNSASCNYDGSITLPNQPEKPGYSFGGWHVRSTNP